MMQDSLANPARPPSDDGLDERSAGQMASVREAIRRGDIDTLIGLAGSNWSYISERYCRDGWAADSLEPEIRKTWYIYYEAGKHLSLTDAKQEKFAFELLRARGLIPLIRRAQSNSVETATTSAGVLWQDLPWFVADMTKFWVSDCATMGLIQRINFSAFLAKLASTGLDNDGLCRIALLVFRDTFETERPIGGLDDPEGANSTMNDLSLSALLPAACAWLRIAGPRILHLSDTMWNDCPSAIGQCGTKFTNSELGRTASPGFSPRRWLYWLKRLGEIGEEADRTGDRATYYVPAYTNDTTKSMLTHVELRDSLVLREFEATGGLVENQYQYSNNPILRGDQSPEYVN